jgi:hypothetical protein
MEYTTDCMQCGKPLEGKRRGALFCKDRCRKRFDRWQKKVGAEGYDPPISRTSALIESRADRAFRAALASEGVRAQPLTDEERQLLARQRRNPGPLLPELQQIALNHEYERMRLETAEAARADPIRPQSQLDPSTYGHLARRAVQSRSRSSKPGHPDLRALRPAAPGPSRYPRDIEAEMTDAPWGRNTPRSAMGW